MKLDATDFSAFAPHLRDPTSILDAYKVEESQTVELAVG